jgi:hypothetical protein
MGGSFPEILLNPKTFPNPSTTDRSAHHGISRSSRSTASLRSKSFSGADQSLSFDLTWWRSPSVSNFVAVED